MAYSMKRKHWKDNNLTEREEAYMKRKDTTINMRTVFKENTSGKNRNQTLTKEEVFKMTKGSEDDKEAVFKNLMLDGEIYESGIGRYRWIGDND